MPDLYLTTLKKYWGYTEFRGIQREIIENIAAGKDTLGLMPTGGGKSVTFQVPALTMEGVCIVITPLIALMKDQVQHLRQRGINATAIYSGMARQEILKNLENCVLGNVKLLYISPERLASPLFQTKLRHMNVSFITVDEAHCISQWGYDFRPSYLKIAEIRKIVPQVAVLALTATATDQVADDIQEQLAFRKKALFRMSFRRENLAYVVRQAFDKYAELVHILHSVNGSAIVYTRSRRKCKELTNYIEEQQISATFYHAGLEPTVKDLRQQQWQHDEKRVMVATNAFGMGIDKPDVRLVVHVDCPDSLEAYFQEAGRAGRDGKKAYAVLLWNNSDKRKLHKRIVDTFPPKEYIKDVYEHLAYYYQIGTGSGRGHTFEFQPDLFCVTYKYFPITVLSAFQILQNAGYIEYVADPDNSARLMFLLGRNELYQLKETTKHEEAVITAILRNYGGLFTDYHYIDEALIASQAGLDRNATYQILKSLSHRRIIHYIPQRKTPLLTYTRDRVDSEDIFIPKNIYEMRKEQYVKRINAMEEYATNDAVCRSRQLLRYFGERKSTDCEICDVCATHRNQPTRKGDSDNPCNCIIQLLSDGEKHRITELKDLLLSRNDLDDALKQLTQEERIHIEGDYIFL